MKKNSKGKQLWKRLHFKYRLSATNENTLDEAFRIRVSMFSGVILLLAFSAIIILLTSIIIIATPIRYYLPGYLDSEIRKEAMQAAFRADTLEEQLHYQGVYINNLKAVLEGNLAIDSVKNIELDTVKISFEDPSLGKSNKEKAFVAQYEDEEKYNLSVLSPTTAPTTDAVIFFQPVKGVISKPFNAILNQFDIEIQTKSKETVSAVLDGRIIYQGYQINDGYVIQIQHRNGFVSIYKDLSLVLKKIGDRVKAGEAIAIIEDKKDAGNSHLSFELWFKGDPINPTNYISF